MINKSVRMLYLPLFAGGLPFALAAVVNTSLVLTGEATVAEVMPGMLTMTALALFVAVLMGGIFGAAALQESATIRRLIDGGYWARFPQYRSEEDWRSFAEREHKEAMENNKFTWLPVIVVTVIMVIVAAVPPIVSPGMRQMSAGTWITLGTALMVFYVFLLILTVGGGIWKRRQAEATYRRRIAAAIPTVYIGKNGLYDEDEGYEEFKGLNTKLIGVEYKDTSPASLKFVLYVQYSMGVNSGTTRAQRKLTVRVLADYREEAKALAERFEREGLIKKPGFGLF